MPDGCADNPPALRKSADIVTNGVASISVDRSTQRWAMLINSVSLSVVRSQPGTVNLLEDAVLRLALASAMAEAAPGSVLAEHALTYGHLIDGVLRAAADRLMEEVYADVVRPVADIDAWFGVPERPWTAWPDSNGSTDDLVAEVASSYERALAIPPALWTPYG
jgi:hypothetical protein